MTYNHAIARTEITTAEKRRCFRVVDPKTESAKKDIVHNETSHSGRKVLFVLLVLLSPVAAFLCGFCCCLGVMQFEGAAMYGLPKGGAMLAFYLGIAAGLILTIYLLVRLRKKLFANRPTLPDNEVSDSSAPPL